MHQICDYNTCTGCMACVNICKHNAIAIVQNNEGFYIPQINPNKCVECGLCIKRCPANTNVKFELPLKIYSGWINNENIRLESSSGGAFTAIATPVLKKKGIVFGAKLNQDLKIEHTFIEKEEDLYILRGSKYVQSYIGDSYKKSKQFLQDCRIVLFSGTPCQIAGLKNFLQCEYSNLLTVDLICHGVPSPKIYEDWKLWFKKQYNVSELSSIKFRAKKKSWIYYNMYIKGVSNNGKSFTYIGDYYKDTWIRGFLRDYFLRPSCHQCKYTKITRCSDFTIADWWGYKPDKGENYDFESKGVSLIMCNTKKGYEYFSNFCKRYLTLKERTLEEACKTNKSLNSPFPKPENRDEFWNDYYKYSFNQIIQKYMMPEKNLSITTYIRYKMKASNKRNILLKLLYRSRSLFNLFNIKI